jgi:2-oxo-4-hydroxy-4-carboxy--5-ureidoimidazoline (OHCU) decarboxylase
VRELPRQLSREQLHELFSGDSVLVDRLAGLDDPLDAARRVAGELSEPEQIEALGAHPAIGAGSPSAGSAREQGTEDDPSVLAELAELNRAYEQRFRFRFLVFVNRRPRSAIVPILRQRLERTREHELETALDELVAIAKDRWERG